MNPAALPIGRQLAIEAPAKINLFLAVQGRRADGYHDIESLMQKLALADQLLLTAVRQGIRLRCPDSDLPTDDGNLAFRAARVFFEKTGLAAGVDIVLKKTIPTAAGLGGGSSDAAAVLRGLNELYGTGLAAAELHALAGPLGADVPFFVMESAAAWATGIGDCLTPAPALDDCLVLLVNPGFPVSTKWAYESFALTRGGNPYILARGRATGNIPSVRKSLLPVELSNDLEEVTIQRFPLLGEIKQELLHSGADGVLMSGSGPTVFGLFCGIKQGAGDRAQRTYNMLAGKYREKVFLTTARR
ncbi:MAG: 4-(cytidine 5'-diphospho)-2-C-methyl-D-erythritol kinase [Deltaproteobacteria bacterium RIFOXYD12_FULL_57_12]|nr:MAG: 4-(cytidine 5'-diphospho)-2-C-methyl-D-erythritol kinase [Deltaproteobacteria bacterium RIFOXYD12_FULL_57_12]